ncbi:hypothetical protein [Streptomyces sp. NPDC059076]|uniref:hypothetical protein n=1 Tax=unclassified Streptomyces TaxID=2593676 RepID=UPI0036D036BB
MTQFRLHIDQFSIDPTILLALLITIYAMAKMTPEQAQALTTLIGTAGSLLAFGKSRT